MSTVSPLLPELPALQKDFLAHIRSNSAPSAGMWSEEALAKGLQVYRHAYRARLHDCLADIYEKTLLWLGEDIFAKATADYIDEYPPNAWSLDHYGGHFPQFLEARFPDDVEIAELAWLEQAMRTAFVIADPVALSPSDFAAQLADYGESDWHNMRLILQPILYHRLCRSNAAAIWTALEQTALEKEEKPPAAAISGDHQLIVWRQGLVPCFQSFSLEESAALFDMRGGLSFGALCHKLADKSPAENAAQQAGGYLAHWVELGLVVDIA